MRHFTRHRLRDTRTFYTIRSLLLGAVIMILCLMGFSVIISKISTPTPVVSMMANIALCAGCFAAGYSAAKKRRRNGIITGLYCGAAIYFIVYLLGLIIFGSFVTMSGFMKLIMALICSSIGGIFGVNTKIRRPPP